MKLTASPVWLTMSWICHDSNPAASTLFGAVDQAIEQTLRTYQLNARDKGIELVQDVAPTCHPS